MAVTVKAKRRKEMRTRADKKMMINTSSSCKRMTKTISLGILIWSSWLATVMKMWKISFLVKGMKMKVHLVSHQQKEGIKHLYYCVVYFFNHDIFNRRDDTFN